MAIPHGSRNRAQCTWWARGAGNQWGAKRPPPFRRSAQFRCPRNKLVSPEAIPRAAHNVQWVCPISKLWPRCGHLRDRSVRVPGPVRPTGCPQSTPCRLGIHTQPDPDHFCKTCGNPSELVSLTITPRDGNETMAREVSPWAPRCADPWCQSRRPRHSTMSDTRVGGHRSVGTAEGVPGHGSVSVSCQLCGRSRCGLARVSTPAARWRVSAPSQPDHRE